MFGRIVEANPGKLWRCGRSSGEQCARKKNHAETDNSKNDKASHGKPQTCEILPQRLGRVEAKHKSPLLLQQLPRDHQPLNLACAFADSAQLYVAVEFLRRIVFDKPVPAVNLYTFVRAPHRNFAGI